jgi:HAMP domain-containing protein
MLIGRSPKSKLGMKIRAKINLVMLAAFVVGMGLAAAGAYTILKRNAIAESVQNGRIIMEAASAIRSYTANNIDPLLQEQLKVQFLPESIPFFAAKVNLQMLAKHLDNYTYREPTLNPTNINDKANDWEASLIDGFRNDPQLAQSVTVRDTPAGDFLVMARPLKVNSKECLPCHSTPAQAPATMVALYGTDHGFGWKLGDIVGAQVVSIPLAVPLDRAYTALFWFMLMLAAIFLVVIVLVDVVVRAMVVKPVEEISDMASRVSLGQMDAPELVRDSKDEIGSLAASFNRMRRSLQNAMKMLEGQAD